MLGAASAFTAALGIVGLVIATACYSYAPTALPNLKTGSDVVLDVTDVGRIHLGPQLGPEVSHLQGRLITSSDTAMQFAVDKVSYINGSSESWLGPQVTLRPDDIKLAQQRTLSRSQTALTVVLIAAGVVAGLAIALHGSGADQKDPGNPGPGTGAN